MKTLYKYQIIIAVILLSITHSNTIQAQAFEDRTIDAVIVTPVSLISFKATKQNTAVLVTWAITMEQDNSHFVIQRSIDGVSFVAIAQVASRGNTNNLSTYNFTDVNTPNTNIYYRLQQVDLNGQYTYSQVLQVRNATMQQVIVSVVPNPSVSKKVNVTISQATAGQYTVNIKNIQGVSVVSKTILIATANYALSIQLPRSIHKGIYLLQVINSDAIQLTKKIVIE